MKEPFGYQSKSFEKTLYLNIITVINMFYNLYLKQVGKRQLLRNGSKTKCKRDNPKNINLAILVQNGNSKLVLKYFLKL